MKKIYNLSQGERFYLTVKDVVYKVVSVNMSPRYTTLFYEKEKASVRCEVRQKTFPNDKVFQVVA